MQTARKYKVDMCNGPLFSGIVLYAIPLIMTGILQLLYNAINIVIVGRFVGSEALAAIGSTANLINLIINLFIGLSIGASLEMAKCFGAQQPEEANKTVHTSIALSTLSGITLTIFGMFFTYPLLKAMGTPDNVMGFSMLYTKIYFLGMPASLVFNFSGAILRAVGDTRRPLYFLFISGVVNVALDLIFVNVCHMGIAGVATATVISQYIAAVLTLMCLVRPDEYTELKWRNIRFYKEKLLAIVRIGLPAGIQSIIFALSDVLIQTSINSLGSVAMAGNTAATNLGGFGFFAMTSFSQAVLNFTGQNIGAKKYDRLGRILGVCLIYAASVGVIFGGLSYFFSRSWLGIYTADPEVIDAGLIRMYYICIPFCISGIMDVLAAGVRSLGYSTLPMIASIIGVCGIRITWIYTIFAANRTLKTLYISYPASWAMTACALLVFYVVIRRRFNLKVAKQTENAVGI